MIRIGLDANGGDFGAKEMVPGAMLAVKNNKDLEVVLYGDTTTINKYLTNSERITIVDSKDTIDMGEHNPVNAIRTKTDSSLVKLLKALSNKEISAAVTCGPTQAVIVGAHIIIRRMEGFKRPCLATLLPSFTKGTSIVLDCGGNLEVKPEQMVEQARYATIYAKEVLKKENPSIGLFNIGVEEGKGREFDIECYNALRNSDLNFYGNVEPTSLFEPPVDILISDGFTTNIIIKTMEGTAKTIGKILKRNLMHGFFGRIGALLSMNNLNRFKKEINPEDRTIAMVYGLREVLIKSHGSSNKISVSCALENAYQVILNDVNNKVQSKLKEEKGE